MSKTNYLENALLRLLFNAVPVANLADNALSGPSTQLWLSLHTADPGEDGLQNTNETAYSGYARVGISRSAAGWTIGVGGSVAFLTSNADFPQAIADSVSITHFGVGLNQTGPGTLLYSGTVAPVTPITNGTIPRLTTGTQIIED